MATPEITVNTLFTETWNGKKARAAFASDLAHLEAGGAMNNLLVTCFLCSLDFNVGILEPFVSWIEKDTETGNFYVDAVELFKAPAAMLDQVVKLANEYLYEDEPPSVTEGYTLEQFKMFLGYAEPAAVA